MAVTKADLAETLFNELGLNKREAKEFVELFFEKTRQSLEEGVAVKLSGFGNFDVRDKKSRPGRNPKTGEEIPITARRVVTFKASQKLKDRVAGIPQTTSYEEFSDRPTEDRAAISTNRDEVDMKAGSVSSGVTGAGVNRLSTLEPRNLTDGSDRVEAVPSKGSNPGPFGKIKSTT